jgi:hypothetical protein
MRTANVNLKFLSRPMPDCQIALQHNRHLRNRLVSNIVQVKFILGIIKLLSDILGPPQP